MLKINIDKTSVQIECDGDGALLLAETAFGINTI